MYLKIVYLMTKKIFKYIAAHKIISTVVAIVLVGIGYYIFTLFRGSSTPTQYVFNKVQRGDLVVSVSGTGQVSTLSKVEIKPKTTGQTQTLGQIIKVNVINGQTVKAGDVIAVLDGLNALQAVNQARSSVASAQANYDKLVGAGASGSATGSSINNPSIQSAQLSLQNSLQNLSTKLQTDYLSVSSAVYINTDSFFTDPTTNPTITISDVYFKDTAPVIQLSDERTRIATTLDFLKNIGQNILTSSDPVALANDAITKFTAVRNYFDDMTMLLTNEAKSVSTTGDSNITADKNTASVARTTANSAVNDITSALQSYKSTSLSLNQSVTSLPADVAVAQAQLDNAKANLATAQQTYASRIITAPFDGQIGGLTAQIGQQVSSSDVLGTIITSQKVVNVSLNEVDAAKVAAGDPVTLTFDALPNVTLQGTVSYLDPLGTVTQGVVNYAVQIGIVDQNNQLKTGMTSTVNITTQTHPNVLMVPTKALTKVGNRSVVLVPNNAPAGATTTTSFTSSTSTSTASSTRGRLNGARMFGQNGTNTGTQATTAEVHPVFVEVGISNETNTEIISGLNEGDTIVVRTITGSATSASTNTTRSGSLFNIGGGGVRTGGGGGGRIGG